ncbi:hypothetical protein CD928_13880 [Sphingopyxis sp. GW247-27LB]|nr:hypothetical protein CD928_13880 [Sphingopyxis sp. GW247-27LB]
MTPLRPPLQGRAARLANLFASRSGWGASALRKADAPHPNPSPEGEGLKGVRTSPTRSARSCVPACSG